MYCCRRCVNGRNVSFLFFFFFQAEDGIRDKLVTGVQTCALPIYDQVRFEVALRTLAPDLEIIAPIRDEGFSREQEVKALADWGFEVPSQRAAYSEIGRASCRERV